MLHHGLMACGVPVICIESRRPAKTIPIVFVFVSDPVGGGFVGSIAHPGGNITDFAQLEASLAGKWIGLLKELVPNLARAALMFNPDTAPYYPYYLQPFAASAQSESHPCPDSCAGLARKAISRTPSMYVDEKSDEAIVLATRLNKGGSSGGSRERD